MAFLAGSKGQNTTDEWFCKMQYFVFQRGYDFKVSCYGVNLSLSWSYPEFLQLLPHFPYPPSSCSSAHHFLILILHLLFVLLLFPPSRLLYPVVFLFILTTFLSSTSMFSIYIKILGYQAYIIALLHLLFLLLSCNCVHIWTNAISNYVNSFIPTYIG